MKYVAMVLLTGLLLLNGCSDFATQYDRVDTGELRLLDMQFEPAEAAPGDTVTVKAIFAGRQVLQSDARWRISYSVVTNYYGVDTAYDIQPFQPEYIPSAFSDQTSCLAFKIIVPRDMMIKNSSLSQDWVKDIPNTYAMFIPTDVRSLSRSDLVERMEYFVDSIVPFPESLQVYQQQDPAFIQALPLLTQLLTTRIRLIGNINKDLEFRTTYSVRYNRKLVNKVPDVRLFENKNPLIDSVGIYIVPGGEKQLTYDPSDGRHQFIKLYSSSEKPDSVVKIPIRKNHSYFVVAFTNEPDSTYTLDGAIQQRPIQEELKGMWYYNLNKSEIQDVKNDDLMNIVNMKNLVEPLFPPLDNKIKSFTIWAEVYDEMLNELYRPRASALREVQGEFVWE